MPDPYPDQLDRGRHRDYEGRGHQPWIRRLFLALCLALVVLALVNVFGQRSETGLAAGSGATLEVRGPTRVRGGLLYQQRITVRAQRAIDHPRIVLAAGFVDGFTVNTIEPGPQSESSRDGRLVLSYDSLEAGDELSVFMDFQVNPTHVGRADATVELDAQATPLARVPRTMTSFP